MRFKTTIVNAGIAAALALGLAACQRQLDEQGRIRPLQEDSFFADGSSARYLMPGTVPRESVSSGQFLPAEAAGRDLYGIYCAVCHGPSGAGDGIVVRRGFTRPRSFMEPELRAAGPSYFVDAMTQGFKTMDTFADLVDEAGRRAIAAYIKDVLQTENRG